MRPLRILAAVALGLALLLAAAVWLLTLLPRPRPGDFDALVWAARTGRVDSIDALVRAGSDLERQDSAVNGWTPLLHAVHKNQLGARCASCSASAPIRMGRRARG